ncbi:hypothetical protein X798_03261 [Onchocerca flexuosa]|uniref:Uncharacterized protein n=1 Tax=Onchocerca flexuosa TaxID=387005 RepID=A0A238BW72_9BILA|nr:hypothetical protein X798_03261 [Onchocerca flexuosa]
MIMMEEREVKMGKKRGQKITDDETGYGSKIREILRNSEKKYSSQSSN